MTITKKDPDSEFWQTVARGAKEAEGYPDWKRGAMLEDLCRAAKADHERRIYGPTPEQELAELRRAMWVMQDALFEESKEYTEEQGDWEYGFSQGLRYCVNEMAKVIGFAPEHYDTEPVGRKPGAQ